MRINGARIHCERKGGGPPVVFLHAGVADLRMWEPQVAAFAKHFDVIRLDQRGFGESELPPQPWSPVADLRSLMDQLSVDSAHLIGCSMGGALAIDFALEHPERTSKLVGSAIGGFTFRPEHAHIFAEASAARAAGDLDALNGAMLHLFLDGPERPRGYVAEPLRKLFLDMNGHALRVAFEKAPTKDPDPLAVRRLHEINAPTLVSWATRTCRRCWRPRTCS
jgi:pimeloyl-ACP methyl ester carboxylesterase